MQIEHCFIDSKNSEKNSKPTLIAYGFRHKKEASDEDRRRGENCGCFDKWKASTMKLTKKGEY